MLQQGVNLVSRAVVGTSINIYIFCGVAEEMKEVWKVRLEVPCILGQGGRGSERLSFQDPKDFGARSLPMLLPPPSGGGNADRAEGEENSVSNLEEALPCLRVDQPTVGNTSTKVPGHSPFRLFRRKD